MNDFDVIVIGGGSPGEPCVGALSEGGLRVALVERELVGGECSYEEVKSVGADHVIATDDDREIANLPLVDAVADTVNGKTAEILIAKVRPGGVYASVVGEPRNAAKYTSVKVAAVYSTPDRKTLELMAEAVRDGKLVIPIGRKLPLSQAAEGQAAAEKGGIGKVLPLA